MKEKIIIALLIALLIGGAVYAVTKKKKPSWSIDVGIVHPVISIHDGVCLYTQPNDSSGPVLIFPANSYIGDVDEIEKEQLAAEGSPAWSPIVPTIPFDKGDYLYARDGDIMLATRDLSTYNLMPSNNSYTL